MRNLLILLIGITCTGCYSLRNDSPLLLRNRMAKNKDTEFVEYEPFGQFDEELIEADSQVGTGIIETGSKTSSSETDKRQGQSERILDLIEQTDDALLRRILAEKLLQDNRAGESPVGGLSPEERSSAEQIAMAQAESPSFGAQFAEVPTIDHTGIAEPKLTHVEWTGIEHAQKIQGTDVHHESKRQANVRVSNDSESNEPIKSENEPDREPARLSLSLSAEPPAEVLESVVEPKYVAEPFVRPASLRQDVSAEEVLSPTNFEPKNWKDELKSTIALLESSLNADGLADDEQATRQVYLRLLHLIGNNGQQATRSIAELDAVDQQFWYSQMQALTSLLETNNGESSASFQGSPGAATQHAVEHLRQAIQRLSSEADLQVKNVALCREVLGYGQYDPFDKYEFPVGQDVLIYCELENFMTAQIQNREGSLFESEFKGSCTIVNEKQRVVHRHEYSSVRDQGRRQRRDFYMYFPLMIPELPVGTYSLRMEVEDLKGNKVGTNRETVSLSVR